MDYVNPRLYLDFSSLSIVFQAFYCLPGSNPGCHIVLSYHVFLNSLVFDVLIGCILSGSLRKNGFLVFSPLLETWLTVSSWYHLNHLLPSPCLPLTLILLPLSLKAFVITLVPPMQSMWSPDWKLWLNHKKVLFITFGNIFRGTRN